MLTWLHNLSKIGTCLRTAVACSEHDFIPIEVAINCCLHGMWSWLSSRCDYCCARKPARRNAHPLTKTQDLLRLISGAKHPERISLSGVLVFTLAVSLRKARSHYSEHKANQWVPALLIRGPAISVLVVVLWCKDSKMSGSLVDQVNHALSLKQRSSAALRPADWLAGWLSASQPAHKAVGGAIVQQSRLQKVSERSLLGANG